MVSSYIETELELQAQGAAQEFGERRHLLAGGRERAHEFRIADLRFGEFDGCSQVSQLQVFDEFMIVGKAARGARELRRVVPVEEFADGAPFVAPIHHGVADFEQRMRLGMPQA